MNTLQKNLTTSILMALPALGIAEGVPNTFEAGQTASAAEVNANFTALADRIAALESQMNSGEVTAESLQGTYRLHISGALYEFFDRLVDGDQNNTESHPHVEEFAHRDFLNSGMLTLESGGEFTYIIETGIEMTAFHRQDGRYTDETDVEEDETITGVWDYDAGTNILTATITDGSGDIEDGGEGLDIPFHVARDQNTLVGAIFFDEVFFEDDFDENLYEYEIINFNAIRLPDSE